MGVAEEWKEKLHAQKTMSDYQLQDSRRRVQELEGMLLKMKQQ